MPEVISGVGVSPGFAVGPVVRIAPPVRPPRGEPSATDIDAAEARIRDAFERVAADFETMAENSDGDAKDVLAATALIARDPALVDAAFAELGDGKGPATAIADATEKVATAFESMGEYFADRAGDIRGVGERAVAAVLGRPAPGVPVLREPSVIVARDLTPAETVGLDLALIAGIVTEKGGRTSHTAILATQYGIPAVVCVPGATQIPAGTAVAVDGSRGDVTLAPGEDLVAQQIERRAARAELVDAARGPGATADGHPVALLLNIGDASDARLAREVDCEGVGLFRTEFLYLTATDAPSVAKQVAAYRPVFEGFPRVVIRTLDAGADKPLAFAHLGEEENPSLGRRGLRLSMAMPELLDLQLEAIRRAADGTGAEVQVMAPMVATAEEAEWFAERVSAAGLASSGVMIEVPAAALRAKDVLAPVDFGSLGTNDLAQYTMAADRTEGALSDLLDPWQPAVLSCVAAACDGARALDRPMGVCGESAGDPLLALVLVGLGATSLSMAPGLVAAVRASLAMHTMEECRGIAAAALSAPTPSHSRAAALALAEPAVELLVL